MESTSDDDVRKKLISEALELDLQIKEFNLTDNGRKQERIKLLHTYNETKDHAQRILGALAELEQVTVMKLYKDMNLDFDKS